MNQLRTFLYLNEPVLDDYISALEDGLRQRRETTTGSSKATGIGVDAKVLKADRTRGSEGGDRTEFSDSAPARFNRLLDLAVAQDDTVDWLEIQSLDQLEGVARGAVVHFECDAFVPPMLKALGGSDLDRMLELMDTLAPHKSSLGLDMEGMPSGEEVASIRAAKRAFGADIVFVGEDDSDWKVAGKLPSDHLRDPEIDDYVRVVGKVSTSWGPDKWKPLMALPGASLLPRSERRKMEQQRPDDEESVLRGPAVMLDVLAIYR